MRYLLLSLLPLLLVGCLSTRQAEQPARTTSTPNPCTDSLYVALKKQPLEEMSKREHEYFHRKDKACDNFRTSVQGGPTEEEVESKARNAFGAAVVTSVMVVAAGVVFYFTM